MEVDPSTDRRAEIRERLRQTLEHIAQPGTWLAGDRRVWLAGVARDAIAHRADYGLASRSTAKSSLESMRDATEPAEGLGPAAAMVASNSEELNASWYQGAVSRGVRPGEYVECVAVAVLMTQADLFQRLVGEPLLPLPTPSVGEPNFQVDVDGELSTGLAWVPVVQPPQATGRLKEFYSRVDYVPHVMKVLSLTTGDTVAFYENHASFYMWDAQDLTLERGLSRPQIELLAYTTSQSNSCTYCTVSHDMLFAAVRSRYGIPDPTEIEASDQLAALAQAAASFRFEDANVIREELSTLIGDEAAIDAAGLCAAFNAINRLANSTGVELDDVFTSR